jgi:hypothetical protein
MRKPLKKTPNPIGGTPLTGKKRKEKKKEKAGELFSFFCPDVSSLLVFMVFFPFFFFSGRVVGVGPAQYCTIELY